MSEVVEKLGKAINLGERVQCTGWPRDVWFTPVKLEQHGPTTRKATSFWGQVVIIEDTNSYIVKECKP